MLTMAITVVYDPVVVAPVINPPSVTPFTFQIDVPPPLHPSLLLPYPPYVSLRMYKGLLLVVVTSISE